MRALCTADDPQFMPASSRRKRSAPAAPPFTPKEVADALAKGACPRCTSNRQIHYHIGPCPFEARRSVMAVMP